MPAELPLVLSAGALAFSGLAFFLQRRPTWTHPLGTVFVTSATAFPLALAPLVDPAHAAGRALWEWSAVGGPVIRASYLVDPYGAVIVAATVAFSGAALATAARAERRKPPLPALILAIAFIGIALAVVSDLVAGIVLLAVLAALTVMALLAVSPPASTGRAAAYLSIGLQAWVLAALLISRNGSASFAFTELPAGAVTMDVLLAATIGALLFAGLYPVVAWSLERDEALDPGPLGSLVLMPAGIAASALLIRLVGSGRVEPSAITLPPIAGDARLILAVLVLVVVATGVATSGRVPARPLIAGAVVLALLALYPLLAWAHVVLLAAILTTAYAAVVSLALADNWEAVRSDLALAVLWIGIATGSSLGVAGGILALGARAGAAFAAAAWLVPHRDYVALVSGSALFLSGAMAAAVGSVTAAEPPVAVLGVVAALLLIGVELAQVARRFRVAEVPPDLDFVSAVISVVLAVLGAAVLVISIEPVVSIHLAPRIAGDPLVIGGIGLAAALVVVLARTVRPLLPYFELVAERSVPLTRALDPVPVGVGAFRALELTATRANAAFAAFERRAGVWLATMVIVGLLIWSVRT